MHSDNLKKPLRDCGLDTDVHGFRSSFRTWAAENNIDEKAAEAVLAHKEPSPRSKLTPGMTQQPNGSPNYASDQAKH